MVSLAKVSCVGDACFFIFNTCGYDRGDCVFVVKETFSDLRVSKMAGDPQWQWLGI